MRFFDGETGEVLDTGVPAEKEGIGQRLLIKGRICQLSAKGEAIIKGEAHAKPGVRTPRAKENLIKRQEAATRAASDAVGDFLAADEVEPGPDAEQDDEDAHVGEGEDVLESQQEPGSEGDEEEQH